MNRDVLVTPFGQELLVSATDLAMGIGPLALDQVRVPYELTISLTLRTAVSELLALGATPFELHMGNSLGQEGYDLIKKAVKELEEELALGSLSYRVSSETNFPPLYSGFFVTAVGRAKTIKNQTPIGAAIGLVGKPLVGEEVIENELPKLSLIKALGRAKEVYEVLPVGSKGLAYEGRYFTEASLNFPYDDQKSAGPSTCFFISYPKDKHQIIEEHYGLSLTYIGTKV